ncbi:nucleolar protein 9 isoform X2 [Alligator mississippiensis]|uniref:nucleolar protein 9 isoform X2 n=1 Tax=Alligator mississippiensis TaxID=8496 RepID=UPI0003D09635|nr:nucleolar protein 9 isoform X2 [Alligator mississippiensis]
MGLRGRARRGAAPGLPRLEPAAAEYFQQALAALQAGLGPDGDHDLFVTNVLAEAAGAELPVALDPAGSRLLEQLLPRTSAPQLSALLRPLLPALRPAAGHHHGARVLEAALLRAVRLLGAEGGEAVAGLVLEAAAALTGENLPALASDLHGSFVLRSLLRVLGGALVGSVAARPIPGAGTLVPQKKRAEAGSEGPLEFEVPESFLACLQGIVASFQEHLAELVPHRVSSLCLQVALEVTSQKLPKTCAELCCAVIGYLSSRNASSTSSPLLVFLKDPTCSRVLDKVLEVSEPRALRMLYRHHFQGQLQVLAGHGVANFTVQHLIAAAPCKMLGKVLAELGPALEEVLACGHPGVLTALLRACRQHGAHQQEALQMVLEAFHCWDPPARQDFCAPLLASLQTYEAYYPSEEGLGATEQQPGPLPALGSISLHGSLLLQHLLHFANPGPVLHSLAALPALDLVTLACSSAGSHVYNALLASSSVSPKQRRKVLRKLKGHYGSLACSKHGSRVLDAVWNGATLPEKQKIAMELAPQEQQLCHDPFGRYAVRNFALTHFRKRRKDWDQVQEAETRRRELFAEILED